MRLRSSAENRDKREIVQIDEAVQQLAGRIDLDRQPSFREVDLHLVRTLLQAAANLGLVLVQQIVDELRRASSRGSRRPDTSGSMRRARSPPASPARGRTRSATSR